MVAASSPSMTIDELARASGMTVRNIRAHQSRGLLPAPVVRARTGYYGPEHLARLELIRRLQGEGYNLAAIKHLLTRAGGSAESILRFAETLAAPDGGEEPEVVELVELRERFGDGRDAARLRTRAVRLGLLVPLGEDRFEVPSPATLRAGEALLAIGLPLDKALDLQERQRKRADGAARDIVRLFVEQVWRPFDEAGRPEDEWPELQATLEELRSLMSAAFIALFHRRLTRGVEKAFGRELEKRARS